MRCWVLITSFKSQKDSVILGEVFDFSLAEITSTGTMELDPFDKFPKPFEQFFVIRAAVVTYFTGIHP